MTLRIDVDAEGLGPILSQLDQTKRFVRNSITRAVRNTVRYAERTVTREIGRASRLPLKLLKGSGGDGKRVFVETPGTGGTAGSVWIGYNPIPASRIGTPKQSGRGTRVGKHRFPGSFVATMPSGFRSSFHRTDSARVRAAQNVWGITALPIEEDTVPIEGVQEAVRRTRVLAGQRLRQEIVRHLNFELNVKR